MKIVQNMLQGEKCSMTLPSFVCLVLVVVLLVIAVVVLTARMLSDRGKLC